ncbi:hypothetical protein CEXT_347561 [Caerostris extrusa]|uniref:Uncharacterized protein n=1 Tax=Caerostris extrusa TaxID=172846 RepID=A0AAV4S7K5_CAEEX|nr:hypothetical protein CEXT_347561 [Caerostris extrusa]
MSVGSGCSKACGGAVLTIHLLCHPIGLVEDFFFLGGRVCRQLACAFLQEFGRRAQNSGSSEINRESYQGVKKKIPKALEGNCYSVLSGVVFLSLKGFANLYNEFFNEAGSLLMKFLIPYECRGVVLRIGGFKSRGEGKEGLYRQRGGRNQDLHKLTLQAK